MKINKLKLQLKAKKNNKKDLNRMIKLKKNQYKKHQNSINK